MTSARRPLTYVVVLTFVLVAWELLTVTGLVKPILLASPPSVLAQLAALLQHPADVLGPIGVTLVETGTAFAIAAAAGIAVGLPIGVSRLLQAAYGPVLTTFSALPLVILYPILAATLGIGSPSKIALGALYGFFPVAIATSRAAAGVDRRLLVAARTMGARPTAVLAHVVLPAILAPTIAGLRVALALALVTVIAAEFIAGSDGLGYQLSAASQGLDTPLLFAVVVLTCAVVVLVNAVFNLATSILEKGIHR